MFVFERVCACFEGGECERVCVCKGEVCVCVRYV